MTLIQCGTAIWKQLLLSHLLNGWFVRCISICCTCNHAVSTKCDLAIIRREAIIICVPTKIANDIAIGKAQLNKKNRSHPEPTKKTLICKIWGFRGERISGWENWKSMSGKCQIRNTFEWKHGLAFHRDSPAAECQLMKVETQRRMRYRCCHLS